MSHKNRPKKLNDYETSILLKQQKWEKDFEASNYLTTPVYYNQNNEILVVFVWDNNSGMLYSNRVNFF